MIKLNKYELPCFIYFPIPLTFPSSIDVDECQEDNGGCEKTCVNLPGTFQCKCEDGEELLPDQKGCTLEEEITRTTASTNSLITYPIITEAFTTQLSTTVTTPKITTEPVTMLSSTPSTTSIPPTASSHSPTILASTTEVSNTLPIATSAIVEASTTSPRNTQSVTIQDTTTNLVTTPTISSSTDVISHSNQGSAITFHVDSFSTTDQVTPNNEENSTIITIKNIEVMIPSSATSLVEELNFATPKDTEVRLMKHLLKYGGYGGLNQ